MERQMAGNAVQSLDGPPQSVYLHVVLHKIAGWAGQVDKVGADELKSRLTLECGMWIGKLHVQGIPLGLLLQVSRCSHCRISTNTLNILLRVYLTSPALAMMTNKYVLRDGALLEDGEQAQSYSWGDIEILSREEVQGRRFPSYFTREQEMIVANGRSQKRHYTVHRRTIISCLIHTVHQVYLLSLFLPLFTTFIFLTLQLPWRSDLTLTSWAFLLGHQKKPYSSLGGGLKRLSSESRSTKTIL